MKEKGKKLFLVKKSNNENMENNENQKNSIDKRIKLLDLLSVFERAYNWCPSDTIYSKLPMPPLHFTRNDSVVIYYKEIDPKSTEVIY